MEEKQNEKQEVEREEQVEKPTNTGEGDKSKEVDKVEAANVAAERMEKAAERIEKANIETANLLIKQALGGHAEAGIVPPPVVKETDEEYVDRFKKGLANPLADDGIK
jgi:hypothetical protein|tara:strand:+ start:925 stop:1248 length:324 start_codon:yes stop_codon:yes gene_type:complete